MHSNFFGDSPYSQWVIKPINEQSPNEQHIQSQNCEYPSPNIQQCQEQLEEQLCFSDFPMETPPYRQKNFLLHSTFARQNPNLISLQEYSLKQCKQKNIVEPTQQEKVQHQQLLGKRDLTNKEIDTNNQHNNGYYLNKYELYVERSPNFIQSKLKKNAEEKKVNNMEILEVMKNENESNKKEEPKLQDKGLKKLAKMVMQCVSGCKRTTYKQVASRLKGAQDANKQLNIKRRVYDALNVIIALGLFERQGNKIFCKKVQRTRTRNGIEEVLEEDRNRLRNEVASKQKIVDQRKEILHSIQQNIKAFKSLLLRNQNHSNTKQIVRVPFIVAAAKSKKYKSPKKEGESLRFISVNENSLTIEVVSTCELTVMGDLDLIKLIA